MNRLPLSLFGLVCSAASAGARIDLVPDPPMPPSGYAPGTAVHIDVFMVDTGNFQDDIAFRGVFLDFTDSSSELTYPGPDGSFGTADDNDFSWINPFEIGAVFPRLPRTSWVYPLNPVPLFMITLPDEGSVQLGDINIVLPQSPGTYVMDLLNADDPSPQQGAEAGFGFGGPNDPVTIWRAFTEDFTSGTLPLTVVPDPGTLMLLTVIASSSVGRHRKRIRIRPCKSHLQPACPNSIPALETSSAQAPL